MKNIKETVDKIVNLPAQPTTPYPQVVTWLFSVVVMFSFIYVCEITGL
ncbi:MAG: hypothetical protein ACI4B8_03910 [Candidatus Gastranaerophilaceae bacterium]